jgi:RND superfamily putative drug exporter
VLTSSSSSSAAAVAAQAARVPGVYAAVAPATPDYQRDGTAIVTVIPVAESSVPTGQTTIRELEHTLLASPHVIGIGGPQGSGDLVVTGAR